MKTNPPKGMNDILPDEMRLRDWAQQTILDTYRQYGFARIATPALEDAENLARSEGGDNLGLLYQVLKRGDKLCAALENNAPLWDLGLRYDLTLPLARFYACHRAVLPAPFKSIQIDRAYRAERPQKGRLREFIQCDIDILGTDSLMAERELIAVTAQALVRLGFTGFTLHLNDRRVLQAMLMALGFEADTHPAALIILDKLDKIGLGGVTTQLLEQGMSAALVEALGAFLDQPPTLEALRNLVGDLPALDDLDALVSDANALANGAWHARFDRTLVRGQGYYTGAIYEITLPDFPGSIAAGGRYDGMIGQFTGQPTPAVGFSIGFERVIELLRDRQAEDNSLPRLALVYGEDVSFPALFSQMQALTDAYIVEAIPARANAEKQRRQLFKAGFSQVRHVVPQNPDPAD